MTTPVFLVGSTPRITCHLQERDASNRLVDVNIVGADTLKVCFKKPDNTVVEFNGTLTSDGQDGKFYYDVLQADLDQAGTWRVAGRAESTSGTLFNYPSVERVFTVKASICP
jgi:hypothetical protein